MKELSQLKKHILYSYAPRILNLLIVPLQVAILTKNLSTQEYGVLTLLQSSFMMLTFVFTLGIQKFISIKIPGKKESLQYSYFKSLLFLETVFYILFSIILLIFLNEILIFLKIEEYKDSAQVFLVVYFFSLVYNEFGRFLNYRKKIGTRVILGIVEKIVELVLIVSLILIFNFNDIYSISLAYLCLYILMVLIYSKNSISYSFFYNSRIKKQFFKTSIIFGLPLIVSDISWKLIQNVDFYFLSSFDMKIELGIYAFIAKLINYIYLAGSPIIWVVYPYIISTYNERKRMNKKVNFFIEKQYKYSFLFLTFSMGVMLINLEFFVLLLAKEEFLIYKEAYFLYALYPVLLTIMYIQQQLLLLNKKTKFIGVSYFLGLIINIVLNYFFIKLLGIYGAILSTVLSVLFIVIMQIKFSIFTKLKIMFYPFLMLFIIFVLKLNFENNFVLNSLFIVLFILLSYYLEVLDNTLVEIFKNKVFKKFIKG